MLNRHGTGIPEHVEKTCPQCGNKWKQKPSASKKYCSALCRRQYFAERFDRWIANPQSVALPQAYDEFLLQDELPCLVEGCGWRGMGLTFHMNMVHGLRARDFKRAAGFNLQTGVVGRSLAEKLRGWERTGLARARLVREALGPQEHRGNVTGYVSLEGSEHRAKARALYLSQSGPERECRECGNKFVQPTVSQYRRFCSVRCREKVRTRILGIKKYGLVCAFCSLPFVGTRYQFLRSELGGDVVCGHECRGRLNALARYRTNGARPD